MPGKSTRSVLKKVSDDITETRELLNSSTTLVKSLESLDLKSSESEDDIIEKAKDLVDRLEGKIISLHSYFYKHYTIWKNKKGSCTEPESKSESSENEGQTSCLIDDSFNSVFDSENTNENQNSDAVANVGANSENKDLPNNTADINNGKRDVGIPSKTENNRQKPKVKDSAENKNKKTHKTDEMNPIQPKDKTRINNKIDENIPETDEVNPTQPKDKTIVENENDKNTLETDDVCNNKTPDASNDLDNTTSEASSEINCTNKDKETEIVNVPQIIVDDINKENAVDNTNCTNKDKETEIVNVPQIIVDDVNKENAVDNTKSLNKDNIDDDDNTDPLNIDHNSVGNDIDDCSNGTSSTNKSDETNKPDPNKLKIEAPLKIKCVDIKKLLDPDAASPNVANTSVVVISDSDNEASSKKRNKKSKEDFDLALKKLPPDVKLIPRKKVIVLDDSDNDSDAVVQIKKEKTSSKARSRNKNKVNFNLRDTESDESSRRRRNPKRKVVKDLANISSLSENSSSSSDDSQNNTVQSKKKSKLTCKINRIDDSLLLKREKDKKFFCKAYVPLTKIPAEQLKTNYEKKMLKMEIERLTNLKNLKRSRRRNSESSDSVKTNNKKGKGSGLKKKPQNEHETDISDQEQHDILKDPLEINSDDLNGISELAPKEAEARAEEALLAGINSDNNDDSNDTRSNSDDKDKEKGKEMPKKKKENDGKPKDKIEEKSASKKDDKKSDSDDDTDVEANKEKKKWRKDKLLTEAITESDSEEDFANFLKKRDKQDEKMRSKKQKRKNILGSDSEASTRSRSDLSSDKSSSSNSEESSKEEEKKKKSARRRIKKIRDSSDSDSQDDDKSTRKNIRKVWKNNTLSETTIAAEKEEKERKSRIAERQKKYNQIFEADSLEKATVDKVVLDFNEETEEELLKVDPDIVKHLKPHQAKGIQFMWNTCFESIERTKKTKGSGCILAHCMGLGKTLQVIALVHTLLTNEDKSGVRMVLVVCPLGTVLNWVAEFKKWLPDDDEVEVFELVSFKQNSERMYQVKEWERVGGALILGYDMFRNLTNATNKRLTKKMRSTFQTCLVDPGPQLVICDEGHLLKNEKTSISIAMNRLKSLRRIVLTGTPLQNNMKEYFCMVQFVKPSLLGTYKEYLNRFVNPITNGQYTDSTPHDIQIMRKRSHVLHKLLDGVVQRKDYSVLAPFLPPKHEYVLFVALTEKQIQLYEHYMRERSRRNSGEGGRSFLFVDFNEFQRICTHPRVLLDKSNELKQSKDRKDFLDDESEGSLRDFIDDDEDTAKSSSSSNSSHDSDSGSDGSHKGKTKKHPPKQRITRATAATYTISDQENDIPEQPDPSEWWREYCTDDDLDNVCHSGKITLLFEILRHCELIGDKVLIFSQSLYSLNVIEYFLNKIDEATQNSETNSFCGFSGSWSLGLDYFRLDGSSSCDSRAASCKKFNDTDNTRARLFLISTRAGGLGINLVAANRVIIFDVSWNPSHDTQSIYRVYRFGQTKPSYIYRFVTLGTMEMKIYERQVIKQAISKRVIDEQQIDRHYNQNDLAELYKFEPVPDEERPIPLVPKDVLLGELLQADKKIYRYHEHQSLLENKVDEVLDEEERKAAWEEFENEKIMRTSTGTINNYPVQMLNIGIQSIIRKQNPSWQGDMVTKESALLFKRLQEEVQMGNSPLFQRVVAEVRSLQQAQENYYKMIQQQHALLQYQQQLAAQQYNYTNRMPMNPTFGRNINRLPSNGMPNPAAFRQAAREQNPTDYIDLND